MSTNMFLGRGAEANDVTSQLRNVRLIRKGINALLDRKGQLAGAVQPVGSCTNGQTYSLADRL